MFPSGNLTLQNDIFSGSRNYESQAYLLFEEARFHAVMRNFGGIFRKKAKMPTLGQRLAGRSVRGQREIPAQNIEIKKIIGTESRSDDFDVEFNPTSDRMRDRWVSIARMRLHDSPLPAVELIQLERWYFVRDGHHRVSVGRALGAAFIEAKITVLDVE